MGGCWMGPDWWKEVTRHRPLKLVNLAPDEGQNLCLLPDLRSHQHCSCRARATALAAPLEWTGTPWDWVNINLSALKLSYQVLCQSSTKVTNIGAEREDWQVSWHRELAQHPRGRAEYSAVQSWAWTLRLEGTILAELLPCNAEKHHLNTTVHSFPHRKGPIHWVSWSLNKRLCPQPHLLTNSLLCWSSASGAVDSIITAVAPLLTVQKSQGGYTRHRRAPVYPCRWVRKKKAKLIFGLCSVSLYNGGFQKAGSSTANSKIMQTR